MKKDTNAERNIDVAFDLIRAVIENPDDFPDNFVAIPLDPELLQKLFSRERVRLLRTVQRKGPFTSLDALTKELGRNKTRVSRDVSILEAAGLIQVKKKGRTITLSAEKKPVLLA